MRVWDRKQEVYFLRLTVEYDPQLARGLGPSNCKYVVIGRDDQDDDWLICASISIDRCLSKIDRLRTRLWAKIRVCLSPGCRIIAKLESYEKQRTK